MATIGTFTKADNGNFIGTITTLTLKAKATPPACSASRVRLVIFPVAMTNLMYQKSNHPAITEPETGGGRRRRVSA